MGSFFSLSSPSLFAEESFSLKKHFRKGEEKGYATLLFQRFEFPPTVTGQVQVRLQVKLLVVYSLKTLSVNPDGSAVLLWKFLRIYLYRWQAGMMFAFDTAARDKDLQNPLVFILNILLQPLIGKTFEVHQNQRGEILSIRGSKDLFKKTLKNAPPAYQSFLKEGIKKLFSPEAIKGLLRQSHPLFPKKALQAGDTWKETIPLPRLGAEAHYKYTLLGKKKRGALEYLELKVECQYKKMKDGLGVGGEEFLAGRAEGRYFLDLEGNLLSLQTSSDLQVLLPGDNAKLKGKEVFKAWKIALKKPPKKEAQK